METGTMIIKITTSVLVCLAAYFDLREMRIPNKISFAGILIGLILNLVFFGIGGLGNSLMGMGVGFAWVLLYLFGALGAGDIKLFMAVGALVGWEIGLISTFFSFLAGGVFGIGVLLVRKNGMRRLKHLYRYLWLFAMNGALTKYEVPDKDNQGYFSFGVCIAAGTLAAIWIDYYIPLNIQGIFY